MNENIKRLITRLINNYPISTFIETGSYFGNTSLWASELFDNVYTIEKSDKLFQEINEKLSKRQINCILGDSPTELANLLKTINERVIFWLDAHWSGDTTSGLDNECPLVSN